MTLAAKKAELVASATLLVQVCKGERRREGLAGEGVATAQTLDLRGDPAVHDASRQESGLFCIRHFIGTGLCVSVCGGKGGWGVGGLQVD